MLPNSVVIFIRAFKLELNSGNRCIYGLTVLMFLLWAIAFVGLRVVRPTYAELESRLIAMQYASSGSALKLAKNLMEDYPSQCMPYEIAANLYTLKKDFSTSETILRTAIENCPAPPALYVRLAHFYQRVMPEKLNQWILEIRNQPSVLKSPTLTAKLLCIAGHQKEALRILETAMRSTSFSFDICMMLSRLYAGQKKNAKARQVLMQFAGDHSLRRIQKEKVLKEMFSLKAPMDRRQTNFCLTLILQLADSEAGYVDSRRLITENLEKLMALDKNQYTAVLLQKSLSRIADQDLKVWLSAIYLQKIEKPEAAYAMLGNIETTDVRLLEEKAHLSLQTHDPNQIKKCWLDLLKCAPNDLHIRLAYAQILNQNGFRVEGRQVMAGLKKDSIPSEMRRSYFSLCFENEAALKDYPALVDTWIQAAKYYTYDDFLFFKDIIFSHLPETDHHREFLKALEARRTHLSSSKAALELLRGFVAEQLRDSNLYFTAADAYLTNRKNCDAQTINTFVAAAVNKTTLLLSPNEEGKIGRIQSQKTQFAVKWSTYLAQKHPNNLKYRSHAIIAAYLNGRQTSDLEERCRKLLHGNEKNHHHLQIAAETFFRIDRFEQAADYYQKLVALRPDVIRYQLSYADCLNKLDQYDQSRQIYTRLLTQPSFAAYDMEVVLQHLWVCYEKLRITDNFIDFIDNLKQHPGLDLNGLRLAAGTLLLQKAQFLSAERLLKEFIENSPSTEKSYEAYLKLANCYALQEKYNDAVTLYSTCLDRYQKDVLKTIDCLYNRAEMKRRKGDYKAAVKDWNSIAKRYPDDEIAAEALLAAASLAHETMQDLPQARNLYQAYLDLPKDDSAMEERIKEKLAAIGEER